MDKAVTGKTALPDAATIGAALIGAGLMLAADFGARVAGFPYELPLGLFATLLGAPRSEVERVVRAWDAGREPGESFAAWAHRAGEEALR